MTSSGWNQSGPASTGYLSWDDPVLRVGSDTTWRAQYRLLQSWYRENILHAPPGCHRGRLLGNHLLEEWLVSNQDANFLTEEVAEYVRARVPEVLSSGGTLDEKRLCSNLLSSMPMCFNLFGHLRAHRAEAARPLAQAFELDIASITRIEVEWAPPPAEHLGDRTAFDALIWYMDGDGRKGFIGVETKYTEPFSPQRYDCPTYREVSTSAQDVFRLGAADVLVASKTNQLWRNLMLAISYRDKSGFDFGPVAVVYCDGDKTVDRAVGALKDQLIDPHSVLRQVSFERIIDELARTDRFVAFAERFRQRYLDLTPVRP